MQYFALMVQIALLLANRSMEKTSTKMMEPAIVNNKDSEKQEDGWNTVPKMNSRQGQRRPRTDNMWSGDALQVEPIPQDASNIQFQPFMLLLVGLPGSGKSTFATTLVDAMPYKFARVNQDELGSRKKCESHAKEAMDAGFCVIVDRCNFDASQRKVWSDLAVKNRYPVDCLVFQVPIPVCIQRCQERSTHETIAPKDASRIVNMVKRQWKIPHRKEQEQSMRKYQVLKSVDQINEALVWFLHRK